MMRRLYARIAVGIIFAVLAGSVTVTLVVPRLAAFFQEDAAPRDSLTAIAARLDEIPPSQWSEELNRLQLRSRMSLRILDGETLLAEVRNGPRGAVPSGSNVNLPALYLPIRGGSHFLVLEPFARLDQAAVREHHRGLGLGPAIVRRIVEAHGGSITISEAPEGGTSVLTRWPLAAKPKIPTV